MTGNVDADITKSIELLDAAMQFIKSSLASAQLMGRNRGGVAV